MQILYTNTSLDIFEGFYNSLLSDFNFETEPEAPKGFYYDVRDFKSYMQEVGAMWTDYLKTALQSQNIIKRVRFVGIDSPREYNFRTDRIELKIDFNSRKLREYCYKLHAAEFNEYLRDHWSSRPGFVSFVANNLNDFKQNENLEILIEFYLLNTIDFQELNDDLNEYLECNGVKMDYFCLSDATGCKYDYILTDDCESVIIGDKINEK